MPAKKRLAPPEAGKNNWAVVDKKGHPVDKLTVPEVEHIFCETFGYVTFPGWTHQPNGQLMLKITDFDEKETGTFNFYTTTGRVLIQAKPEIAKKWQLRWPNCAKPKRD